MARRTDSPGYKKSILWKEAFTENADDRAFADCRECEARVPRGGAVAANWTTHNLWQHLERHHVEVYKKLRASEEAAKHRRGHRLRRARLKLARLFNRT